MNKTNSYNLTKKGTQEKYKAKVKSRYSTKIDLSPKKVSRCPATSENTLGIISHIESTIETMRSNSMYQSFD